MKGGGRIVIIIMIIALIWSLIPHSESGDMRIQVVESSTYWKVLEDTDTGNMYLMGHGGGIIQLENPPAEALDSK